MSDTPESDKQWADWINKLERPIDVFIDFARRLERERNKLRASLQRITECDMRWSKKIARDALEIKHEQPNVSN